MKAILQFKEYDVLETIYKFNPFSEVSEDKLIPEFEFSIDFINEDKTEAFVLLAVTLGDETLVNHSFFVKAKIMGYFEIHSEADVTQEMVESLYHVNALAIIFPYLRSLVSDLTSNGSEMPITLPTFNIAELVKNKIENKNS